MIAEEHAILLQVERLVEKGQAAKDESRVLVDAEGERHAALLKKLNDLDDVFGRIGESNN